MNGGPIDLTPFGSVLNAVGILYWILALVGLVAALWQPRRWWGKAFAVAFILVGFGWMPIRMGWEAYEARERLDAATSMFELRCKTAGEKISRTIENVEGVVWMKWRPNEPNYADQFKLDDPYGKDCSGEGCIGDLLRVAKGADLNPQESANYSKAYLFVDSTDPGGRVYRYTGTIKLRPIWTKEALARQKALTGETIDSSYYEFALEREPIEKWQPRYGIT